MSLLTCQAGYEPVLVREIGAAGGRVSSDGSGWVSTEEGNSWLCATGDAPAFAHRAIDAPVEVSGSSVNALARGILEAFATRLGADRVASAWPCLFGTAGGADGLGRRAKAVEAAFMEMLKKRFGRLARLADSTLPRGIRPVRGLFVWFTDFDRAFVGRDAFLNGQCRMADDPLAPSRSYLKIEEAYGILGREPQSGDTVCDLGAAPGGWSYSAAQRGARVTAIDNGPLKGGALDHPCIEPLAADAFHYSPDPGSGFDWLFCDLLEEPHHVLGSIVEPWLSGGWCRRFIVNFKAGRVDPVGLIGELKSALSPFVRHASGVRYRHLFHDRDEFTVTGEVIGKAANKVSFDAAASAPVSEEPSP